MSIEMAQDQEEAIEQRVDDYVRGKMSEEEECAFEEAYMDDPVLRERVEIATRLKEGLSEVELNEAEMGRAKLPPSEISSTAKDTAVLSWGDRLAGWIGYIAVPQTVLGAVVACLILLPDLEIAGGKESSVSETQMHVYYMNKMGARHGQDVVVKIDMSKTGINHALEYIVGPIQAEPPKLTLKIEDEFGKTVWENKNLKANSDAKVYISITKLGLGKGRFLLTFSIERKQDNKVLTHWVEII